MNVIICGAGEVGRHAAEVLGAEANDITVIDRDETKLAQLDDQLDVRSLQGNGTQADVLLEAGCAKADLFIAATNIDEMNLLAASVAKAVGARTVIARVHHSAYFDRRGLDYARHLGIDHLVCPEYATGQAIAAALRSPGALVMERFAHGQIEMQQLRVSGSSKTVGQMLRDIRMPGAARLAAVERKGHTFLPMADTVIEAGDIVTLIGDVDDFVSVCRLFDPESDQRKRIMIMGGTSQCVWLCRALRDHNCSVRLFEPNQARALELADKLDWITVIQSDPMDSDALQDERVDLADAFVALTDDDEKNILGAARAKSMGVKVAIAALQRPTYLHLLEHVGIDRAFSSRVTAVNEILWLLKKGPVRHLATLSQGVAEVYEVHVPQIGSPIVDKPLKQLKMPAKCNIAAIHRGEEEVFVPGAESTIQSKDTLIVIGPSGQERDLRRYFLGR